MSLLKRYLRGDCGKNSWRRQCINPFVPIAVVTSTVTGNLEVVGWIIQHQDIKTMDYIGLEVEAQFARSFSFMMEERIEPFPVEKCNMLLQQLSDDEEYKKFAEKNNLSLNRIQYVYYKKHKLTLSDRNIDCNTFEKCYRGREGKDDKLHIAKGCKVMSRSKMMPQLKQIFKDKSSSEATSALRNYQEHHRKITKRLSSVKGLAPASSPSGKADNAGKNSVIAMVLDVIYDQYEKTIVTKDLKSKCYIVMDNSFPNFQAAPPKTFDTKHLVRRDSMRMKPSRDVDQTLLKRFSTSVSSSAVSSLQNSPDSAVFRNFQKMGSIAEDNASLSSYSCDDEDSPIGDTYVVNVSTDDATDQRSHHGMVKNLGDANRENAPQKLDPKQIVEEVMATSKNVEHSLKQAATSLENVLKRDDSVKETVREDAGDAGSEVRFSPCGSDGCDHGSLENDYEEVMYRDTNSQHLSLQEQLSEDPMFHFLEK